MGCVGKGVSHFKSRQNTWGFGAGVGSQCSRRGGEGCGAFQILARDASSFFVVGCQSACWSPLSGQVGLLRRQSCCCKALSTPAQALEVLGEQYLEIKTKEQQEADEKFARALQQVRGRRLRIASSRASRQPAVAATFG